MKRKLTKSEKSKLKKFIYSHTPIPNINFECIIPNSKKMNS